MRMNMRANDREYTYDTMIFMNEMLVVGMALLDFTAIALVSRFGREWLYGLIGVNLILISTTGAKLIEHFGLITNVGNVFYAAVFLCLFLLIEHYGHRSAIRGIWLGFALLAFFIGMTQFVLSTVATSDTRAFDLALHGTFTPAPRILLASLFAYFVSTYTALWIFAGMRERLPDAHVWVRTMLAVLCGQFLDSILFFSIAFGFSLSFPVLVAVMLGGFLTKSAMGALSLPFISLSSWYRKEARAEE